MKLLEHSRVSGEIHTTFNSGWTRVGKTREVFDIEARRWRREQDEEALEGGGVWYSFAIWVHDDPGLALLMDLSCAGVTCCCWLPRKRERQVTPVLRGWRYAGLWWLDKTLIFLLRPWCSRPDRRGGDAFSRCDST